MLEPLTLPFVQRGLVEILILAVPAGLLGTWIVLRGLAFLSHAAGTAAFPGLVLADGLGFAAPLGALGAAAAFALCVVLLRGRRAGRDAAVAIALVGALAIGVVLASDVFESGPAIETLLFGSLLLVDGSDIAFAAAVAMLAVASAALLGGRWLGAGFDPGQPVAGGPRRELALDAALIGVVALAIAASLTVVGSLLVAALFVVPAATARLLTDRMRPWQALSVGLVAAEGTLGLWASVQLNAPPGATIAVLSGLVFASVAGLRALSRRSGGLAAAALVVPVLAVGGCGGDDVDGRPDVVATTTQVGDIVGAVGGGEIDLHVLLRPGADPHGYEPRPRDVLAAADAEVAFASGAGLDGWVEEILSDAGSDAVRVELADVTEGSPEPAADGHDHEGEGEGDPHWWQDPMKAVPVVREVQRALTEADPGARAALGRRADRYVARLEALDSRIAACIGSVPASRRRIVTDHDAFGAFADRYGIEVVGVVIPARTTEAQPSARDLSELVDAIEAEGVGAVLTERSLSPAAAQAVARQTGADADLALYGDSLGPEGSPGGTYLGMLAANADVVMRAITAGRRGCDPRP